MTRNRKPGRIFRGPLAGLLLLAAAPGLRASSPLAQGSTGAAFLKLMTAARASGMGGAGAALSGGLESLQLNPAGIAALPSLEASASQVSYLQGINLETLSLGGPLPWGTLAGSATLLASPEIQALDSQGNGAGTFSLKDSAFGLAWAARAGAFSLGLQGRSLSNSLAGESAQGFSADLGALAALPLGFQAGLAAQNLGSLGALESQADPLPWTLRLGLSWDSARDRPSGLVLALDTVQSADADAQVRAGLEGRLAGQFFARAGLQWSQAFGQQQLFAAGAGLRELGLGLDYAFVPFGILGNTQLVSLTADFGQLFALGHPEARPPSAPLDLVLRPSRGAFSLSWNPPASAPAAGYFVYVSKGPGEPLEKVNQKPGTEALARLRGLDPGREYSVAVSAVDAKGREGALSPRISARPDSGGRVRLAPPEPPQGLAFKVKDGLVDLRWEPNPDKDIAGYVVYASRHSGNSYVRLEQVAPGKTSARLRFKDQNLASVLLMVRALRRDGPNLLESDPSQALAVPLR